jgi:heme exporter protein A
MLQAIDLECIRGDRRLFSGLSFDLPAGVCLHLAGPNGAGKTSLQRILCGLLPPERGEVRFNGEPIAVLREEYWQSLAYIGHLNGVKDDLSATENLRFAAALGGRPAGDDQLAAALAAVQLVHAGCTPARRLSQGQKRRIALARLHLEAQRGRRGGGARLWILDEPFTALDVQGVQSLADLIQRHLADGGSVVLSTHQDVPIDGQVQRLDLGVVTAAAERTA